MARLLSLRSVLTAASVLVGLTAQTAYAQYLTERPDYAGVWVNTFGKPYDLEPYAHLIAGEADRFQWSDCEKARGRFDFSRLRATLQRCEDRDYYYYGAIWTAHHPPEWLWASGVPQVHTHNGWVHPYYLDPVYREHVKRFMNELAAFVAGLPPRLRERIAFLQAGFGSTGDRQLYKGKPVDARYEIDSDQYVQFMKEMTVAWHAAFNAHPQTRNMKFLWNVDDYDGANPRELERVSDRRRGEMLYGKWMRENYDCQFRKQQFTLAIGYMAVNEREQDKDQRADFYGTSDPPRWGGNPEFVRGEFNDPKWAHTPMARQAPKWHYYWTAVSSVDRGLDGWETKPKFILAGDYDEAYAFSTRHAFYKKPKSAKRAFIALRDVLDYSDKQRFPEDKYGHARKNNTERINRILSEYAAYGARNDDTRAVVHEGGAPYLLKSQGLNDCVWNVIDRNYRRHMTQQNPNDTSVGWWRVGSKEQPYGRFARAFEQATRKDEMRFSFDPDFVTGPRNRLKLKVIYFDKVRGSTWELRYDAGPGQFKTAIRVTCEGDGVWKSATVDVHDAVLAGNGPHGSDLALVNTDDHDDVFHLIEAEKPGAAPVRPGVDR